jgi:hypothetical protein
MTLKNGKLILILLMLLPLACAKDASNGAEVYRFTAQNQLGNAVSNAAVTVDLSIFDLRPGDCNYVLYVVGDGKSDRTGFTEINPEGVFHQASLSLASSESLLKMEIPSQCDDLDGNGTPDELFFLTDFDAGQTLSFELVRTTRAPVYERKTQAFLKVQSGGRFEDGRYVGSTGTAKVNNLEIPNEQIQGSGWPHMEGPVWESDLVGYRFYLDARNRVDIFSKSMPDMVLDTITQNYHQIHPWGTDVLKVGNSLGLGSLAAFNNGRVQAIDNWSSRRFEIPVDGPLRSIIRLTYRDWQVFGQTVTVVSEFEIHAGNRYTEQRVTLTGQTSELLLATGIVKHELAEQFFTGDSHNSAFGWTTGNQSDQGHRLDMGIVVPMKYSPQLLENDPYTHLYTISPVDGKAVYRYTSAWEFDHDVVDDFEVHVRNTAGLLTMPPRVVVNN